MYGTQQSKARSVRQARDVYRREFIGAAAARVEARGVQIDIALQKRAR
jgi:hypothetical protein